MEDQSQTNFVPHESQMKMILARKRCNQVEIVIKNSELLWSLQVKQVFSCERNNLINNLFLFVVPGQEEESRL